MNSVIDVDSQILAKSASVNGQLCQHRRHGSDPNLVKRLSQQQTLLDKMESRIRSRDYWFSLEFFPPRTANGAANLCSKFESFVRGEPLFCDITWHVAGTDDAAATTVRNIKELLFKKPGDPASDKPTSSLMIANVMLNYCGMETMLHITCYGQKMAQLKTILQQAKAFGISNILALRGDPPQGRKWVKDAGDLNYAAEFVRFIRTEFPSSNDLLIGVAGYPPPRGHPDSTNYEEDLLHLKEKMDAGANFVITQLFFKVSEFLTFVQDCRNLGITCPIIPGIFPIQSYQSMKQITALSQSELPDDAISFIETHKLNDETIRNFGIDFAVKMCRELLGSGVVFGLHFYTLNRDVATISIVKQLGLWRDESVHRPLLPWKRQTANPARRQQEEVRPIFWANHPRSYVYRTLNWDEFPNGRWGDSNAASFGDFNHHAFYIRHLEAAEEGSRKMLAMWGESLETERDVWDTFVRFITDTNSKAGVRVSRLPWNEHENLAEETHLISTDLIALNSSGMLTINSQPNVNGIDSGDPVFGWGAENGVVYQKAYLEFFMPKEYIPLLLNALIKYPLVNYHIIDADSSVELSNSDQLQPIAVTWGVFPGREIVQPTVVDPVAFRVWKDEAFSTWLDVWAELYPENSNSRQLLQFFHDNYCLVNLVDNQFTKPTCLFRLCRDVFKSLNYDSTATKERMVHHQNGAVKSSEI